MRSHSTTGKELHYRLVHYLPSVILLWLAIAFYFYNPYYQQLLNSDARHILLLFAYTYTICGALAYLFMPRKYVPTSKSYLALRYLAGQARRSNHQAPNRDERMAILFLLVKLFFLPLMISFLVSNFNDFGHGWENIANQKIWSMDGFSSYLFPLLFSFILLIDTAYFTFGYMFEARFLHNQVRSVDSTALGWIVCLACYPPFNDIVTNLTHWYANDYAYFGSVQATFVMQIVILLLMGVYLAATVALGPKASNLTNRGIVTTGPYHFIRHPAYVSKNLAWWLTLWPVLSIGAVFSMAAWSFLYFMRAVTEERHLSQDPDYRKYCKQVPNRFLPSLRLAPTKLLSAARD